MTAAPSALWAPWAWLNGGWAADLLLRVDAQGRGSEVRTGTPAPPDADRLPGPVLPALMNAHSHAFQRAFVGMAKRRDSGHDDFWGWRDRMYSVALRITPDELRAVAAHGHTELLAGGYTHTCEFHYLHHAPDSGACADPMAMSRVLADAAVATGMGLTLLAVSCERAGFQQPALRHDQRRFAANV